MMTATRVEEVPAIARQEAVALAAAENERMLDALRSLGSDEWSKPTDCQLWDVRALAGHVLGGMEGFASFREFVHQMRSAKKAAGDGPFIDGMTAVHVQDRRDLTTADLLNRTAQAGPASARARGRVPGVLRRLPLKQEVGGKTETWRMGYLLDVILTRDTWMHRVDLAGATGSEMELTPEHDGRIVADVVAEWGRRHGQAFTLELGGPAGGTFTQGSGGEHIAIDAVEFCRILSGRSAGEGLLTQEVPF
jgi:uncharacterized protein (TIGR03083 family)